MFHNLWKQLIHNISYTFTILEFLENDIEVTNSGSGITEPFSKDKNDLILEDTEEVSEECFEMEKGIELPHINSASKRQLHDLDTQEDEECKTKRTKSFTKKGKLT